MVINKKGRIGVLIEEGFDELQYRQFNYFFSKHGYKIDYISNLRGQKQLSFKGQKFLSQLIVTLDFKDVKPSDYQGIILIGGYAMDHLRYQATLQPDCPNQSPAIEFLREAVKVMDTGGLKIGTICRGLWLFCAAPELLKGRKVTCVHNIIDDVKNAGGIVVYKGNQTAHIYVDIHLISARHSGAINEFLQVFLKEIESIKLSTKNAVLTQDKSAITVETTENTQPM
jgi:protease I